MPWLMIHQGANLPHWRLEGATYAVTFRLADSLPAEVLERWRVERDHIVPRAEAMGRPLTEIELCRLDDLHSERVEAWLDKGHGSCALREERLARLVRDALLHFDRVRYDLIAWCVMPNHVHAVVRPLPGHELSKILLSWKGFTGKKVREILDQRGEGAFWQKESYDHIIRDAEDLARQVRYVLENPANAGLGDWAWVGGRSTAQDTGRKPGAAGSTALPGGGLTQDTGRKPGATSEV